MHLFAVRQVQPGRQTAIDGHPFQLRAPARGSPGGPKLGSESALHNRAQRRTLLRGALLGGVLIGVLENLVGFYVSPAYKEGVALMLFLVVILVRPEGLLGKAEERKV